MKISVVIPTFNEMSSGYLQKSVPILTESPSIELIIVDRKSTDGTAEFVQNYPIKFVDSQKNSRAGRLNEGILSSTGEWVLLHHPRSLLQLKDVESLLDLPEKITWGAFTHRFDKDLPLLKFTSWYSNEIRGEIKGIYYLDHCMFFKRHLLADDPTPIPEVDIFEDTELSKKLLKFGDPVRLNGISTTSAIRFVKNGPWRQGILNQVMKVAYSAGASKETMNKIYEAGLSLNSKY